MWNTHAWLVAAPVAGLAVYCLSHVTLCRLLTGGSTYSRLVGGFLPGLVATLAATMVPLLYQGAAGEDIAALAAMNFLAYVALAYGYFNFVNLNIASLRIRMLLEMQEAGGSLRREQLLGLYNTDSVIEYRIARLLRGGHLVERGGRFYNGRRRFLLLGRTFDMLRWMILGSTRPLPVGGPTNPDRCLESKS